MLRTRQKAQVELSITRCPYHLGPKYHVIYPYLQVPHATDSIFKLNLWGKLGLVLIAEEHKGL